MSKPRPRAHTHASPATLALLGAGLTVTELAEATKRSRPAVSSYLLGRRPMPPDVASTIRRVVGPESGHHILSLIPNDPDGTSH